MVVVMSATFSTRSCSLARLASCSDRETDCNCTSSEESSVFSLSKWTTADSSSCRGRGGERGRGKGGGGGGGGRGKGTVIIRTKLGAEERIQISGVQQEAGGKSAVLTSFGELA